MPISNPSSSLLSLLLQNNPLITANYKTGSGMREKTSSLSSYRQLLHNHSVNGYHIKVKRFLLCLVSLVRKELGIK